MTYQIAETFTSVQGEGLYTGVPMTFIRFVGCSVGKRVCNYCDTDFDRTYQWRGGGEFTVEEILRKARTRDVCLTGGEPLNQDLVPLLRELGASGKHVHVETSGTVLADWIPSDRGLFARSQVADLPGGGKVWLWVTVSPKPGYLEEMLSRADELKVIVPGLGIGPGWPDIDLAKRYSALKPVYLQPRNEKHGVNFHNLNLCMELVLENPDLRLSAQLHKFIAAR